MEEKRLARALAERVEIAAVRQPDGRRGRGGGQPEESDARHDRHVEVPRAEEVDLAVEVDAAGRQTEADIDAFDRAHAHTNRGQNRRNRRGSALAGLDWIAVLVLRDAVVLLGIDRVGEGFGAESLGVQPDRRLDFSRAERPRRALRLGIDATGQGEEENEPEELRRSIHVARSVGRHGGVPSSPQRCGQHVRTLRLLSCRRS